MPLGTQLKLWWKQCLPKSLTVMYKILLLGSWIGTWKNLRCWQFLPTWCVCVRARAQTCACARMFILTVYDRSKFSIGEVSCKQGKGWPCCEFALMTAPSFPSTRRSNCNSRWNKIQCHMLCSKCCLGWTQIIRTLSLPRLWLNIRIWLNINLKKTISYQV